MRSPLVSVVIPVHDRALIVPRAIGSALGQTVTDVEVIVVDDHSADDLASTLDNLADPRLRTIRQPDRRGAAAARNAGIRAARGRYIAFLDSDDEWLPEKLHCQLEALDRHRDKTRLVVTGCHLDRGAGRREQRAPPTSADQRAVILSGQAFSLGSTGLIDRTTFLQVGCFDESLHRLEDWDWLLRYSQTHDLLPVPQPLAIIHVTDRAIGPEVKAAIQRLRQKHGPGIAGEGRARARRFKSATALELALRAYLDGRYPAFVRHLVAAVIADPRVLKRLSSRIGGRLSALPHRLAGRHRRA
ncbi:MAG: glycosyltransferase family 2 protein [Rhodospirillaceae bacterium]|nr:glycosyltransferase family 2 protein [Rhodospirillaceae bacterium]